MYLTIFIGLSSSSESIASTVAHNHSATAVRRSRRVSEKSNTSAKESMEETESIIVTRRSSRGKSATPVSPVRRSRRLSERSNTPVREIENTITIEKSREGSRINSATPQKLARKSPAPSTPRKSPRKSREVITQVSSASVLEPLLEEEEDAMSSDLCKEKPTTPKKSAKKSPATSRNTREVISEVSSASVLEPLLEEDAMSRDVSKEKPSTPKKSAKKSSATFTPRKSPRISRGVIHQVASASILEPVLEEEASAIETSKSTKSRKNR